MWPILAIARACYFVGAFEPGQNGAQVEAVELNSLHNARVPQEQARLKKEFPKDADIVVCKENNPSSCYVKVGSSDPGTAPADPRIR